MVIKTQIPTVFHDFLSLKNDVNEPSKSNEQKNRFFVGVLKVNDENSRIPGSVPKCHGSETLAGTKQYRQTP
jgi:hypothetical protein